ncbi:MAG TPA: hypothetical protein VFG10_05840 [Saprospiraceae bacterium]|nr:hypothetical protein [Saprospiraceae bacterium]
MFLQITEQLKQDLLEEGSLIPAAKGKRANARGALQSPASKPVLQLNMVPAPININQYLNPYGPTNPNGDYLSLFKFRDLTNDIPDFNTLYFPSGNRIDEIYGNVVTGVTIQQGATFTQNAFLKSQQKFASAQLSSLSITPDPWWPVYANPTDWITQAIKKINLSTSEINLQDPVSSVGNDFTIIGNPANQNLDWNKLGGEGQIVTTPLNKNSVLNTIKYKFLVVKLNRPWLDLSLFSMGGWFLGGQEVGFVSSGDLTNNAGVFPLYPTAFILATDLEITGDLNHDDTTLVKETLDKNGEINLGSFNITSIESTSSGNVDTLANPNYFIIAWISQLVGLTPKVDS